MATGTLCAVKTSRASARLADGTCSSASMARATMASMKSGWSDHGGAYTTSGAPAPTSRRAVATSAT
jgi:hypothetical protein